MQDNITTCKLCGRLMQKFSSAYCSNCLRKIDSDFIKVREYIYKHMDANIAEISQDTGVEENVILLLLREGRLSLRRSEGSGLQCEKCGVEIVSGKLCEDCQNSLTSQVHQLQESIRPLKPSDGDGGINKKFRGQGMHIRGRNRLDK